MENSAVINTTLEVFALVLTLVLIVGMSQEIMSKKRWLLMQATWLHLFTIMGDLLCITFLGKVDGFACAATQIGAFTFFLMSVLTCMVITVYLYTDAMARPMSDLRTDKVALAICFFNVVNALMVLVNPFTHALYDFDSRNLLVCGPLLYVRDILFFLQELCTLPMVYRLRKGHGRTATARLLFCGVLSILATLAEMLHPSILLLPAVVSLVLVLLCVGVQAHLEEELAQARTEVAESRIRLLSGQIHPHFIFNSLNAIKALVVEDPPLAERTIQDFSDYLRSHLDEMSSSRLVPFEEEMGHVRHYVSLEKADIARPLEVCYELEVVDFLVPPLTVQPLVENAIRHGIRTRQEGGTVVIATKRAAGVVTVTVSDDGHGLSSATARQDQRRRVGIENVRERLERQCGGTLEVKSGLNGTIATMTLPESEAL